METTYIEDKGYILLKTFDDLSKDSLKQIIKSSVDAAHKNNCNKVLFDHRGCHINIKLNELFNIAADVKILGLTTEFICAIIYDVDPEKYKFSEKVINNRINPECRFFDDFSQGLSWLLKGPPRA